MKLPNSDLYKRLEKMADHHEQSLHLIKTLQYYEWLSQNGINFQDVDGVRFLPNEKGWDDFRRRCKRNGELFVYTGLRQSRYKGKWASYLLKSGSVEVLQMPPFPENIVLSKAEELKDAV